MSNIGDYLDQMEELIKQRNWVEMERRFYNLCKEYAGLAQTEKIKQIHLDEYESRLRAGLHKALHIAEQTSAKAVYFEYDLDHSWDGCFFICDDYSPRAGHNDEYSYDDWACDWLAEVEGPSLLDYANIYHEHGFDRTQTAVGSTLYLIARTVMAFARAVEQVESNLPICIAFHDQDPIFRVKE